MTHTLARFRHIACQVLDRIAFAVESVAIAVSLLLLISFFIIRSDWLGTAHEWGLFWTHYAEAPAVARRLIDHVLLGLLAVASLGVSACRIQSARTLWRRGLESLS